MKGFDRLLAFLAAVLLVGAVVWDLAYLPSDRSLGLDFTTFYAAGLVVRHGGDPYNLVLLHHVESHLRSIGDPRYALASGLPYSNPPLFAWALAGLTLVPLRVAYLLWTAAMFACLCAGALLVARIYGVRRPGLVLLFAASPITAITLFLGQPTPLLLLSLAACLALLCRGRPALAGLALTICWIKPQLFLPVALVIVALLEGCMAWRALAGLLGGTALLAAVSCLVAGGALFGGWLGDLVRMMHGMETTEPAVSSLAGLYRSVLGPTWIHVLSFLLPALWLGGAIVLARRARGQRLSPEDLAWLRLLCVALAGWLLATPYTHIQDLVLLAAAWPVLVGLKLELLNEQGVRLALCALLIAPEADLMGFRPNLYLCYSMLVPLTLLAALWSHRSRLPHAATMRRLSSSLEAPWPPR